MAVSFESLPENVQEKIAKSLELDLKKTVIRKIYAHRYPTGVEVTIIYKKGDKSCCKILSY